jgi:hypothetical protein
MRLWYWCSLIVMALLFVINIVATPILTHSVEHHIPVHKVLCIGRDLPEDQMITIIGAAWEWHTATNGLVNLDVVRMPAIERVDMKSAIVMVVVSPDFPNIIALDNDNPAAVHLAYYTDRAAIPYIGIVPSRIEERSYKTVVMHELGHSLGLPHTEGWEGIGTLMYPDISVGADYITDIDLHNFCELYGCDATNLHDE